MSNVRRKKSPKASKNSYSQNVQIADPKHEERKSVSSSTEGGGVDIFGQPHRDGIIQTQDDVIDGSIPVIERITARLMNDPEGAAGDFAKERRIAFDLLDQSDSPVAAFGAKDLASIQDIGMNRHGVDWADRFLVVLNPLYK